MNRKIKWLIIALTIAAVIMIACDERLKIVNYTITTDKVNQSVRMVLISDLHSCYYGKDQEELVEAIKSQSPDMIVMAGDIADDEIDHTHTREFLAAIGKVYPCYYVSGNHEFWSGEIDAIKEMFRESGVTVLEGDTKEISMNGQSIILSGVDDPDGGRSQMLDQLKTCKEQIQPEKYNVLLVHRPEMIETYLESDYDLILAGHAHGGQWRLPGLINGLYAPNQGRFPKYAGGQYQFGSTYFIVSRGLARESTRLPRIFNRPELVVIDLVVSP